MPPPRFPRVPDRLPFPDTTGPEPSQAAFDTLWAEARAVRIHAGGLGEHGPLERASILELRGEDLATLARLLAFEVPQARFRVPGLMQCALEPRGRVFRVGLLGLDVTGALRVMGWGSDVRLRDPRALFSWIAAKGGPRLIVEEPLQRAVMGTEEPPHAEMPPRAAEAYRGELERRRGGKETWTRIVREPLGRGAPEALGPARRGVVTGLALLERDLLAVFRNPTQPWFGAPRAMHDLLRMPLDGASPDIIYKEETEPGVSISVAAAPRADGGARAWLWSAQLEAIRWIDLPSGAVGRIEVGAPVWGLGASLAGAYAVVDRGGERLEVLRLEPGGAPVVMGALRCRPSYMEVCADGDGVLVAAHDKIIHFPA